MGSGNQTTRLGAFAERTVAVPEFESVALRRRAQMVILLATGLVIAAVPTLVLVVWLLPHPVVNAALVVAGFACYACIRWLISRRQVSPAAWLLVAYFTLVPIVGSLASGGVESGPFFVPLIVVVAASVLPPRQVAVAALLAFADLAAMYGIATDLQLTVDEVLLYTSTAMVVIAAAAVLLSLALKRALDSADIQRRSAQRLAEDLKEANSDLEIRVTARTSQLQEALRREQLLSAKLGELSVRDSLTGLHNRRHLDEEMLRLFAYAQRTGQPLSVAVIDLDNFKHINDSHTHLVGDEVLRRTAKVLVASIRGSDVLVRMGGEEFALLMPGTDEDAAFRVCERMRLALEETDWCALRPQLRVTASVGVACSLSFTTAAELIRAADELLYRAKRRGKNRVVVRSSGVA